MRPYISKKLCDNCKQCVDICPYDVFSAKDSEVSVENPEECIECTACIEQCPHKAIHAGD